VIPDVLNLRIVQENLGLSELESVIESQGQYLGSIEWDGARRRLRTEARCRECQRERLKKQSFHVAREDKRAGFCVSIEASVRNAFIDSVKKNTPRHSAPDCLRPATLLPVCDVLPEMHFQPQRGTKRETKRGA
jgi:hypothetical protein